MPLDCPQGTAQDPRPLDPSLDLLRVLLRAALADDWTLLSSMLEPGRGGRERRWAACAPVLAMHRLESMVGALLRQAPEAMLAGPERALRTRWVAAYEIAVARNVARLDRYAELLAALRARGVEPVLLKSGALVALDVMHLGHSMTDVDALIRPEEAPAARAVLESRGYTRSVAPVGDWNDPSGALRLDLHQRMNLFAHLDLNAITVARDTGHPGLGRVRVLEPNAFVVHLIVHLNEHRSELGYRLGWLLDLGRALRAWRAELRWRTMSELVRWPRQRMWMLRTLAFFARDLGMEFVPADAGSPAAAVSAVTLAEVLRSSRTRPWRFPTLRAWTDLGRRLLGKDEGGDRLLPRLTDPFGRAFDVYRERRDWRRLRRGQELS